MRLTVAMTQAAPTASDLKLLLTADTHDWLQRVHRGPSMPAVLVAPVTDLADVRRQSGLADVCCGSERSLIFRSRSSNNEHSGRDSTPSCGSLSESILNRSHGFHDSFLIVP